MYEIPSTSVNGNQRPKYSVHKAMTTVGLCAQLDSTAGRELNLKERVTAVAA